jgi:diguanylate cyclase (GGDEF)-like protein
LGGRRSGYRWASIGIAIFPDHGNDETQLMKCADDAMYSAKAHGCNKVEIYTPP